MMAEMESKWEPGKAAASEADFRRALEFLSDPESAASKAAFLGAAGGESAAAGRLFGAWLARRAREINSALEQAGGDRRGFDDLTEDAKSLLMDLAEIRGALADESFEPFAKQSIGLKEGEAKVLAEQVDDLRDFSGELAEALSESPDSARAIAKLRESPEWRRAVKGSSERRIDAESYFAPLLECIAKEAGPALKAELTAKMELYIESGWAERDILGEGKRSRATSKIRKLCEDLKAGNGKTEGSLKIIGDRFAEIFMTVQVKKSIGEAGEEDSVGEVLVGKSKMGMRQAGAGVIDAVLRDARDPRVVHAAIVTADESTWIENNQIYRHQRALRQAIKDGAIEGASEARISFYVPSLFYDRGAAKGREIGEQFLSALRDRLSDEERQTLNAMPFLSAIGRIDRSHPHYPVEALAGCDLRMIGARAEGWNKKSHAIRQIKDPQRRREAFLGAVGEEVAKAADIFRKKRLDGSKLKTGNSNRTLLGAYCEAVEGLVHHAADFPEALSPLGERLDDLRVFRAQLSGDSEMKRRMEGVIMAFSREGGIAAWAKEALASEALEKRLAKEAREEQEAYERGEGEAFAERVRLSRAGEALRAEAKRGGIEALAAILDRGARVADVDERGLDAAEIAAEHGHKDAALFLAVARDKQVLQEEIEAMRAQMERKPKTKAARAAKAQGAKA